METPCQDSRDFGVLTSWKLKKNKINALLAPIINILLQKN
jgi:hypothetical protein